MSAKSQITSYVIIFYENYCLNAYYLTLKLVYCNYTISTTLIIMLLSKIKRLSFGGQNCKLKYRISENKCVFLETVFLKSIP